MYNEKNKRKGTERYERTGKNPAFLRIRKPARHAKRATAK